MDYDKLLQAFERGIDDGFFRGDTENRYLDSSDDLRDAYQRGYDHGVWMHCEANYSAEEA
jgi:hypothetical protein